jgi:molecular chaperone HtpG
MATVLPLSVDLASFIPVMRSLFQSEHVYIRELIQNALEAMNQTASGTVTPSAIRISTDMRRRLLEISDAGIGMTRQQMENDLTRIFSTGWPKLDGSSLGIGQFGFGFFSSFLAAQQVDVVSRSRRTPKEIGFKHTL